MTFRSTCAAALVAAALLSAPGALPESRLAVWDGAAWRPWWSSASAPVRWTAPHPVVASALRWTDVRPGLETATLRFAGDGEAWRFNVVVVRVDPARLTFALHVKRNAEGRALPWGVDETPDDAALALNAGMFDIVGPWGWVVLDGNERQPPGFGPISSAIVVDSAGAVRIVPPDSMTAIRARRDARWAVQSYPTALQGDGEVLPALRAPGRGVNVAHRDARIAVGTLRDGRVLVALTRFDGLGGLLDAVPLGPTLPEMTAILGALGAQRAVFLDGGISAQMAVRRADGSLDTWEGLRKVPLSLVARVR